MTAISVDDGVTTRILEAYASSDVLVAAAKANSAIKLWAGEGYEEDLLLGTIVGTSKTQLEVEISPLDHHAHTILSSPVLFGSLDDSDRRYVFKTHYVTNTVESEMDVVRLARPTSIAVVERRRSRRRAFRRPTELVLHTTDPESAWCLHADMLNLSPSGVACRIREADAGRSFGPGETIRVEFGLGRPARRFDLTARVITRTRGGTPGHAVLGMEFVDDGCLEAARKRMREVLAQPV